LISIADLEDRSIEIITSNQHSSGSYIASPNFSIYNYCWIKDGAFTAYAMDLWGQKASAERFFHWSHNVISRQAPKLKRILDMKKRGDILLNDDYLSTKYMLDGSDCNDEWPNFQLDGYGTWLWALSEHIRLSKDDSLAVKYKKSIKIVAEYLINFWDFPCYDCWQENGEKIHTSTLAAIYGGLNAIKNHVEDERIEQTIKTIKQYVLENLIADERLKKCTEDDNVDGSLLWAAIPFRLFEVNDLVFVKTIKKIENELLQNCGVKRYVGDTYYGGGEWIVLSVSLGLYYCETKQFDRSREILQWIERSANEEGELSEQILEHVEDRYYVNKWKSLWGEVASPVLWAHAMYLILLYNIQNRVSLSANNASK